MSQNVSNNFLLGDDPHDVYLANGEGFTESGRTMIQEKVLPTLVAGGVAVYEPFREFFARATQKYWKFDLTRPDTALFGASSNALAIRNAKLVLAILDGVDVDSGTASEIGFAYACGKPIAGIRTDFRWNSADGMAVRVNLQVEGFITMSWGKIYDTYAQAMEETIEYVRNFRK